MIDAIENCEDGREVAIVEHCDGSRLTLKMAFAAWRYRVVWRDWYRTRSLPCGCPHPFSRFKCPGCKRMVGHCMGGAPDPRCDRCAVWDPVPDEEWEARAAKVKQHGR